MSTKVTQSMTVTESTSTVPAKIAFNVQVLQTKNGILKLFELVIGIVCLVLIFDDHVTNIPPEAVIPVAFLNICLFSTSFITLLLLLSYLMSPLAESLLPKTIFELVSDITAFLFFISTAPAFLVAIISEDSDYPEKKYAIAVGVMGVVNALFYILSSYYSFKTFRST